MAAEVDIRTAKNSLNSGDYYAASFWSHQATEKALKTILINKTGKFPKIHDLVKLGKLVELDQDLLKECEKLT